jgi:hypothetical protein
MDVRRLVNLQLARLAWVHHSVSRSRGTAPDSVAGTVCTVLAAVIGMLEASRDGNLGSSTEPTYTDSLLALTLAADRVVRELRLIRLEWR